MTETDNVCEQILRVVKGVEILLSCCNDVDMKQAVTEFTQKHARLMQRALVPFSCPVR